MARCGIRFQSKTVGFTHRKLGVRSVSGKKTQTPDLALILCSGQSPGNLGSFYRSTRNKDLAVLATPKFRKLR